MILARYILKEHIAPFFYALFVITFLFLLLSSIHRAIGRGLWKGIGLTLLGFIGIAFFMANT